MSWIEERQAVREEAQRRRAEKLRRHQLALRLREEGLSYEVISTRTSLTSGMLHALFKRLGRRQ